MMTISESGMTFGPFDESEVYHIERSRLYAGIGQGLRTVEFILSRDRRSLAFIEAKSSPPRPGKGNTVRFDTFIQEISDKFLHAFNLYYAAVLNRHPEISDIPHCFQEIDNASVTLKFCLIIQGHEIDWLPPISDALCKRLAPYLTIWGSEVAVLNDMMAKKYGLIC